MREEREREPQMVGGEALDEGGVVRERPGAWIFQHSLMENKINRER